MLKNKILSLIVIVCFICLSSKISLAEEIEADYEYLHTGEYVKQSGFFFTEKGMINLILSVDEKIKLINVENQKNIDLLRIEIKKISDSKKIELDIQSEMYEKRLEAKQKTIDSLSSQSYWSNLKIIGGTLLGIGAGFLVFKLTSSK